MRWIAGVLINAVIFIAISGFFKEFFFISSFAAAVGASIVFSLLNILVRPVLIILTLPITLVTLGLFLFVINAITLLITDSLMGSSFEIAGFGTALLVAVVMSIINLIIHKAVIEPAKEK